ncbi:GmrSD restriction endonuclease domain-containing protein [Micromonospora sp. CA-248212]|uniref:GmrSD restriction endonuclease domain-containing protein n=1 Tax=Micromonospora sp. CA-248212 TaxID=3239961 RepID=UPI003D89FF2C
MSGATINGQTFTLQDLFDRATYDIDYYQREYAWTHEDIRTLVNDLCTQFEEAKADPRTRRGIHRADPYFLGPFVYYEQRRGLRFLVDGQQRFTTLHLIFMHLYRQALALGNRNAVDKLVRVIREPHVGGWRFRINIAERRDALQALYDGRDYDPPLASSLSLRNLCTRSEELRELLEARIEAEDVPSFVDWILNRVLLVGIEAPSRDSGFKIFESMNDRGARLTPVDLLKSYLLSRVGHDEEELNLQWRKMLAELTPARDDPGAPSRFLKAALVAHHGRLDEGFTDVEDINSSLHLWVKRNAEDHLALRGPHQFFGFVERLIRLASTYRTFQSATHQLDRDHGLEALYFNNINGLSNQMAFVLAAIRPGDTLSVAKEKARLVANFIDRWYVVRVLTDESALDRDLDELMPKLIPQLRKCERPADVASFLVHELPDDQSFHPVTSFGLRGNNSAQVKYLLARLTAFAQTGWGEHDLTDDYLASDRRWQIEHIFPNRPERHSEGPDPIEFRLLRNRIGVLGLLKASVNASLQDTPIERKIEVYRSENLLLRCLHPMFQQNNKPMRTFIQLHDLQGHLRPLGSGGLRAAVTVREELYRRLCAAVWRLDRLGFSVEAPVADAAPDTVTPAAVVPAPRKPAGRLTDVQRMLRDGVLSAGTVITAVVGNAEVTATIEADGAIRLSTGDVFRKADDAGRAVKGRRCEGMKFWQVSRPDGARVSLRELRDAALSGSRPI